MNYVKIDKIYINLTVDSIFCYLGNNSCLCRPFQALALRPGDGGGIARRSGERTVKRSTVVHCQWALLNFTSFSSIPRRFVSARAPVKIYEF